MRACRKAEEAGIPAFAIASSGFVRQAHAVARPLGIEHVWVAEYPGVIPNDSDEVLRQKVRTHVVPSLVDGFVAPLEEAAIDAREPGQRTVVFAGTLREVQDLFDDQLWSDGLPIVPPTLEAVDEFLRCTDRDPSEIIGAPLPEQREATVWNVAVNGVMAGCAPEHMPILLAIVEAMCDPEWHVQDAGSTPGWEPLVVLSGPGLEARGFLSGPGMMRVGRRANSTVGRFTRLYMRNIPGLRTPPGDTDKGSVGFTFNVAMPENESAVRELGWSPLRVDQGFGDADTVVTLQSVVAISPPIYSGRVSALEHIEPIARVMENTMAPWGYTSITYRHVHPLLLMSPSVAGAFAAGGWGKDDIRQYLYEHLGMEERWFDLYPLHVQGGPYPLSDQYARGVADERYAEAGRGDPSRRFPLLLRPEWTSIVVGGDPLRNQCRAYINNHEQGAPVSRRVAFDDRRP